MAALQQLIGSDDRRWQLRRSSGSGSHEHSAEECLSEMVIDYLEDAGQCSSPAAEDLSDAAGTDVTAASDCTEAVGEIRSMVSVKGGNVEAYRELIESNVQEAVASSSDGVVSQRRLMMSLRELHHNAAICKTKWGSSRGLTAGDYEFVDVVHGNIRYLIDTNFRAQFEIARPTIQYMELLKSLPVIFVGRVEELKKIVRIMCDAAERSLSRMNLSVPPWRTKNYMQNKWLGPYRRTVNLVFDKSLRPVKCRWIGFNVLDTVKINGGALKEEMNKCPIMA